MLGSSVLNGRQHVGLQKLSALAGVSHSFLGPDKKYKFIQDETSGESVLVRSCFGVFENLDLTCAVGQLVHETLKAQQNVYHSGSGCLLFLAGAWSRSALECLQRGITVPHIISAMSEGTEICMDVSRKCSISTEGLGGRTSERKETSQGSCTLQKHKILNVKEQRRVKLSRHFCETASEDLRQTPQHPDIRHIAEGLSHGCDETMKLVVEAIRLQSATKQQDAMFDLSKVMTCVIPGLTEEHACVIQGCVFLLSSEQTSVVHHLKEKTLKVVLITGDLSDTFRHLGFNRPKTVQHVKDQMNLSGLSRKDEWVEKLVTLLLNLEVNLILSGGVVCEKVIQQCVRHHILLVEKVKASVLKTFSDSTGAVPVTYVSQLSRHFVGTGVKAAIWREVSGHKGTAVTAVTVSTGEEEDGGGGMVTAVLTSCLHRKLQVLDDQFWSCAHRLHHALKDKTLLPGAGQTEIICIHHLQKKAEAKPGTAAVVLRLMADGLIDYISTIMINSGRFSKVKARTVLSQHVQDLNGHVKFSQFLLREDPPVLEVYDNVSVKQEVWRKALDLVSLVLQTDAEIITGVKQDSDNLMML